MQAVTIVLLLGLIASLLYVEKTLVSRLEDMPKTECFAVDIEEMERLQRKQRSLRYGHGKRFLNGNEMKMLLDNPVFQGFIREMEERKNENADQ